MKGYIQSSSERSYLIDRDGGLLIWQGQQVPTGARIGRVGMSGRTTGPTLGAKVRRPIGRSRLSSGSDVQYSGFIGTRSPR